MRFSADLDQQEDGVIVLVEAKRDEKNQMATSLGSKSNMAV